MFDEDVHVADLAPALWPCACGGEGDGDVTFTTWGEDYIEEGIPSDEFSDEFAVRYEQFLIVVGNVTLSNGSREAALSSTRLFDLVEPGPHPVGTLSSLPAGHWDQLSYENPAADGDTRRHSSASEDDLDYMQSNGYRLYVSGTVWNDGEFFYPSAFPDVPASAVPQRHITAGAPRTLFLSLSLRL